MPYGAPGPTMAVGSSAVGSRLAGQPSRPRLTARPSTLAVCVGGRARNQADPTCCGKPAGREHYRAAPRVSSIFGCHRRVPRGATPLLAVATASTLLRSGPATAGFFPPAARAAHEARELAYELQRAGAGAGLRAVVFRASRRRPPGHVSTSRAKPWKVGVSRSTSSRRSWRSIRAAPHPRGSRRGGPVPPAGDRRSKPSGRRR